MNLARRAWIGRRFEHNQLTPPQMRHDRLRRVLDEAEVWFAMPGERGRHAKNDRVHLGEPAEIAGRREPARAEHRGDALAIDMADIGLAPIEPLHLAGVDIEAEDRKPLLGDAA